jgi:hypothetical protein
LNKNQASQTRVSVVSLDDRKIVDAIFREIQHTTATHRDLRRQIFRQVAKSAKLQHMLLDLLSKDAEVQKAVLQELAKNAQLKRKFVVVAHEQQKTQATSVSRKRTKTS